MPDFTDVFISATTDEFGRLRRLLARRLRRRGIRVDEQTDFARDGAMTLEMLESHVARCRIVVHLLGRTSHGASPSDDSVQRLKANRAGDLNLLEQLVPGGTTGWFDADSLPRPSYTQWEALLALLLRKRLLLIDLPAGPAAAAVDDQLARHRERLKRFEQGRETRILRPHTFHDLVRTVSLACEEMRPIRNAPWAWPEELLFDWTVLAPAEFVGREALVREIDAGLAGIRRPMLIRAPFGVGKSSLMAHLARRDPPHTVSHFCVFSEQSTLDPRLVARSLASQFALRIERYRAMVESSESLQAAIDSEDPVTVWLKGVIAPLRSLDERPFLLLIDGLDESLEFSGARQDGDTLLELLVSNGAGTNPMPSWLRIIASARDVSQLEPYALGCEVVIDMAGEDSIHDAQNTLDIQRFLRNAIDELPWLHDALSAADGGVDGCVRRLAEACDGKFLLARMWKEEFHSRGFQAKSLLRDLNVRVGTGTLLDMFYARTFKRRVAQYEGLTRDTVRAVLGVVAAARDPLPYEAIAGVLQCAEDDVQHVFDALRGLLVWRKGGVTFGHYSLQRWLDPQTKEGIDRAGMKKASDYAIDVAASTLAITACCRRLARERDPLRAAGPFAPYLRKSGVIHLIDAGDLPDALSLLDCLRDGAASDNAETFELRREELRAIEIIRRSVPYDSGQQLPPELAEIAPLLLLRLITKRDYETGKFEPVMRLLLMRHFEVWEELKQALHDCDEGEDIELRNGVVLTLDIVLRHDIGVAFAEAWHAADEALSRRLLDEILDLGRAQPGSELREIAGYAMKHICQRRSAGRPWYRQIVPEVRGLLREYACSANATDRMVAGEAAIALAVQEAPILDWLATTGPTASFWMPAWPNLACDVDAIRVILAEARPRPLLAAPVSSPEFDSCREQHLLRESLRRRLAASELFHSDMGGRILETFESMLAQQDDPASMDEFMPEFERAIDDPQARDDAYDFIRMLMLHPLWNETERASNLIAALLKPQDGHQRWWIIQRLIAEPATLWRLHYGGVDAAYTAGTRDAFATFRAAVLRLGAQPGENCRVRGICTDDLWAWLKEMPARKRAEQLLAPEIAALLRHWLATADDQWQLEYLHKIFAELFVDADKRRDYDLLDRFGVPTGEDLSAFLRFDDQPFYELPPGAFMQEIERRAQAAHTSPTA